MKYIDIHIHTSVCECVMGNQCTVSSAGDMSEYLKASGAKRAVLMSAGETENVCGNNSECKAICEKFPQFYSWMCNLDMVAPDTVRERLKRYKKEGASGIGELMMNKPFDDPFLQTVFFHAEELNMPVLFHISPEEGYQYGVTDKPGLPLLRKTLIKYPNLTFIGHSQPFWHEISKDAGDSLSERQQWGNGPVIPGGKLVELFEDCPNLTGDLSANSGGCAIMRDEEFGLWFLNRFQDRLMFGSDMVNVTMEFPLASWLKKACGDGRLNLDTYEKIMYKNAERILL